MTHTVLFWLKPELTPADRAYFRGRLENLRAIACSGGMRIGSPAPVTPRPVVDASYDLALSCHFASLSEHDAYQVHPLHLAFVRDCKQFWSKVQIYDFQ